MTDLRLLKWIRIKDQLPEDGITHVMASNGCDVSEVFYCFRANLFLGLDGDIEPFDDITHWMPLPDPPEANND